MANDWPRVMTRGRLKGREFASQAEYAAALAELDAEGGPAEDEQAPDVDGEQVGPPRPMRRTRAPKAGRVTYAMVYAIIFPLNVGVYLVPPLRQDALNDQEIKALCEAIVKVAAVNKYVERAIVSAAEGGAYVELAIVVGAIAIRRAALHGVLPREFGGAIGGMFGLGEMPEAAEANGVVADAGVPVA